MKMNLYWLYFQINSSQLLLLLATSKLGQKLPSSSDLGSDPRTVLTPQPNSLMLGCQRTGRGARHCRVPPKHLKPSVQTCTFRVWINPGQHCANSRALLLTFHYSFNSGVDRSATITCRTHWRPCAPNWPDWSQLVIAEQHLGRESRTISLQLRKSCYPGVDGTWDFHGCWYQVLWAVTPSHLM